jgi:hypothetical protein
VERKMAKTAEPMIKEKVEADVWIERLTSLLRVVDAMDQDERRASLAFLKSKYRSEWPSDDY